MFGILNYNQQGLNLQWFELTYIELEQVRQTSVEAYLVWCIHECGGSGGCTGDNCIYGMGMPCCWKYAYECNLLVIQSVKCSEC
jgi:hypothetical protein